MMVRVNVRINEWWVNFFPKCLFMFAVIHQMKCMKWKSPQNQSLQTDWATRTRDWVAQQRPAMFPISMATANSYWFTKNRVNLNICVKSWKEWRGSFREMNSNRKHRIVYFFLRNHLKLNIHTHTHTYHIKYVCVGR